MMETPPPSQPGPNSRCGPSPGSRPALS
jgi:hypothetical protein